MIKVFEREISFDYIRVEKIQTMPKKNNAGKLK
jgi:hypothetical protein